MIERIAHAKINLALHVTGQRDDGYHLLDSIVVFAEYGDRITIDLPDHSHGPITVSISGPFGDNLPSGPENLVTAAAFLLRDALMKTGANPAPVHIYLEKNLPLASGIGGGSADAAAVLLGLREAWNADIDLTPIAKGLGADVAMCLQSTPLRARRIGDEIQQLNKNIPLNIVLVNPGTPISTPDVFRHLVKKDNAPIELAGDGKFPEIEDLRNMRNDLQTPAAELVPEIAGVLSALEDSGAGLVRMSGSGATCFGVYETHADAENARERIREAHSDWWCVATRTTVS